MYVVRVYTCISEHFIMMRKTKILRKTFTGTILIIPHVKKYFYRVCIKNGHN